MKLSKGRYIEIIIHILGWGYIFASPLLFGHFGDNIDWAKYFQRSFVPLTICTIFYVNYLYLVPHHYMHQHYKRFYGINLILLLTMSVAIDVYMSTINHHIPLFIPEAQMHHPFPGERPMRPHMPPPPGLFPLFGFKHLLPFHGRIAFIIRDLLSMVFSVISALVIRLSIEWQRNELKMQKNRLQQADAALQNLKSQTSPHFLLNTLNNIYSLTAFDPENAQTAILELSKMLRYQLYESDTEKVLLRKEADFLSNYIALMRLRLSDNVKINYNIDIQPDESIVIAPHILICIVENAFKHGISANEECFIDIRLKADLDKIHFVCQNSNHPKKATDDKTPGGIGLQLVEQRLTHVYNEWQEWHHGPSPDGKIYTSEIIIYNDAKTTP